MKQQYTWMVNIPQMHNQNFHFNKMGIDFENCIKGCCIVDFKIDGNSSNFMITLGSFVENNEKI